MNALIVLVKVMALVVAACFLVGSGLCVVGSLINFPSTPGPALGILAISLLIATPSYLLTRAIWRSLTRKPGQSGVGVAVKSHTIDAHSMSRKATTQSIDKELKSETSEPER